MEERKPSTDVIVKAMELFSEAEPEVCIVIWASGKEILYESNCRHFEAFGLIECCRDYMNGRMVNDDGRA
jgi:hypothetical protein